jgi:hypothetical protein
MIMTWFLPLGIAIGAVGTQTALRSRHALKKERTWLLLLVMAWLPLVCWLAAQFVIQD